MSLEFATTLRFKASMRISSRFVIAACCAAFVGMNPGLVAAQEEPAPNTFAPPANGYAPVFPLAQEPIRGNLTLSAKLSEDAEAVVPSGLVWRVFAPEPDESGKLPLLASAEGGTSTFDLEPGVYLVHAAYGRAGATKRIRVGYDSKEEQFVLDAGGLKLDAVLSGGGRISPDLLRFSIYDGSGESGGDRSLIIPNVEPNKIVRLKAGTYHIVSTYGNVNAVVRSDIRVEANELTEASVEHRAAQLTMKLVREPGGEAIADTAWSVLNESGEMVRETVGAFGSMVLAEGQYTVIAKNRDRLYQKDLTVIPGSNQDVELLPQDLLNPNNEDEDDVDYDYID
ncbi:hypothetical protein [Nitratireductor aestuarii]